MAILDLNRQRQILQGVMGKTSDDGGDPVDKSITVQDINNFTPAMNPYQRQIYDQMDRMNRGVGALPNSTYFPAGDANINKGSYQGPTIGNVPVFAPTNLVPYGIYGARQDKIAAAATAKSKSIDDFFALAKPPQTDRVSVQADLDETYFTGLQKWEGTLKQRYGSNWAEASKSDTQFQQWQESMNTVAKYNTGLVEKVSQLEALDKDPNFVLAPTTRKYANAVIAGYGGLANNPYDPNSYGLGTNLLKMNAETDLDVAVNNSLKQYTDEQYSKNPSQYSNGAYDVWTSIKEHGMSDDQIDNLADGIWKNSYGGNSDYFSKQDIVDRLKALYPERATKEVQFQSNQYSAGASGADEVFDPTSINPEGEKLVFAGDPTNPAVNNSTTAYDGQTLVKPIALNVPNSTLTVDASTGKPVNVPANSKIQIGKTFNVLVDKNGNIISDETAAVGAKNPDEMKKQDWHYETYASGTIGNGTSTSSRGGTSTTQQNVQTVWMPVSDIQNGLTTFNSDGSYKKGARTDIQKNNASQRTQQLNVAASTPKPAQQQATSADTFNTQWAALKPGETLVGPDGITYKKK